LCELCKDKYPINGTGSSNPKLFWITLSPSNSTNLIAADRHYLLYTILKLINISISDIYYTSLVKNYSKSITIDNINACRSYIEDEIQTIKPKFIVLEGSKVIKSFFDNNHLKMDLIHGAVLKHDKYPGIYFIPIYDIDKIYEDMNYILSIPLVISNAFKYPTRKSIPTTYIYIDTLDKFNDIMTILKTVEHVAVDIETNGQEHFFNNKIVCITFSWEQGRAACIPIIDKDKNVWGNDLEYIKNTWNSVISTKKTIYHNGFYDTRILKWNGFSYGNFSFDTSIAAKFISNILTTAKLKNLAWLYTSMGGYEDNLEIYKEQAHIKSDYSKIPLDILSKYAMGDADCTFRLYKTFESLLETSKGKNLYYKLYIPLVNILLNWSYDGVLVDIEYLKNLKNQYIASLEELKNKIYALVGHEFNIESVPQMRKILYEELKLHPDKETKTGFSTDKDTLEKLAKKHEVPKLILEHREKDIIVKTFIDGILNSVDNNNRVHTSYSVGLLDTSRISSSNPNLQNLPRSNTDIKKAFIADKGYIYYEFDFSQIEVRVLAHLSRDPLLVQELNSGTDVHKIMASTVFNIPIDKVTDEQRSVAKTVVFGIIYGMGPNSLAERTGQTLKNAKTIIFNFYKKYPYVKKWMNEYTSKAIEQTYVQSYFGKIRYVPGVLLPSNQSIYNQTLRIIVNTPIQSLAADITNIALIKMTKELPNIKLKMQIHDAIIALLPEGNHEQIYPKAAQIMSTAVPLIVKTPVGIKRGYSLGEMKKL